MLIKAEKYLYQRLIIRVQNRKARYRRTGPIFFLRKVDDQILLNLFTTLLVFLFSQFILEDALLLLELFQDLFLLMPLLHRVTSEYEPQ